MAWFPGADRSVPGSSPGSYRGGPWHIIIHTTEGGSAEGAFSAYRANNTWPHFTVDRGTVYQHIDTQYSASAILNQSGGVETNRLQAIQIEMVGYAGQAKDPATLENAAALCRWLEETYGIPPEWPNGRPQGSGGPHNRSTSNWTTRPGYYGHSQVPENTHWDPGFLSDEEIAILMGGDVMEPAHTFINGEEYTSSVRTWLADGNTLMDVSEWCAFSGYPPPKWDNAWADADHAGAIKISTQKVLCELVNPDGSPCQNLSVALAAVPVGGCLAVRAWICAAHLEELEADALADAPEVLEEAGEVEDLAAAPKGPTAEGPAEVQAGGESAPPGRRPARDARPRARTREDATR